LHWLARILKYPIGVVGDCALELADAPGGAVLAACGNPETDAKAAFGGSRNFSK